MNNLKPLGGFIENTIRPLIEEMRWFIEELDKRGLRISESNIRNITNYVFWRALILSILGFLEHIIIALIIGFVLWKTCR